MFKNKNLIVAAYALLASTATLAAAPITVYKTPWCGCCQEWSNAVEKAGHQVSTNDFEDLTTIKAQAGVPQSMEGCHTAKIGDYFLEGHVPLEALDKLISERPDIAGIAVPGMPQGSLGMGNDPSAQYEVYAIPRDKAASPYLFYAVTGKN